MSFSVDFGGEEIPEGGGNELIPDGTLAWALVKVRPHNLDHGLVLVPSKSSESKYLDLELTILEGPYARRKIWDKIGIEGSEKWVMMGRQRIRHIIQVGTEMSAFPASHPNYLLGTRSQTSGEMVFMELDELRCAIKVGIEKGKDGYGDKNTVRQYLSPNPAADSHKAFLKLVAGQTQGEPQQQKAATAASKPAWAAGGTVGGSAPSAPAAPAGRPSWAGAAPTGTKSPDVPF